MSTPNAFAAALGSSRLADIARKTLPGPVAPEPKVEDLGVGPKKYYSMTLNMPNLSSAGGSWIIHFAELKEAPGKGPLTAPVATVKVDPACPSLLARERVEGVVLLYAIIRADGAVGNVRVLRGIDARLDDSARTALTRWHFRPGTRNGIAVDLEAVVQIPFRALPAL
jgi:TonB family protein